MILPKGGETWGIGSAILMFFFLWDSFRRYCPPGVRTYLEKWSVTISGFFNPYIEISIHEYLSSHIRPHKAYAIVAAYLSKNSLNDAKRLRAEMVTDNDNQLLLSMDENEKTSDEFNGVTVIWSCGKTSSPVQSTSSSYIQEQEKKYYKLTFPKKYKKIVTGSYLEHVIMMGKEIQAKTRQRKLYTNGQTGSIWSHLVFEHPATFETLAMEPEKKEEIIEDLLNFTKSKDFYARIGKAWKRGYLLYGPPGTGKSTMVAAMANLLDYDVYDLELTSVKTNTDLKRLLTETTRKSIIVIEDIDCSLNLTGQRNKEKKRSADEEAEKSKEDFFHIGREESDSKVTLSGLLNSIDGLWSACAGERLVVFTTNYINKLDHALTRRGRMDKHIEFSYCNYEAFKVLARNYLGLEGHPLFPSVEELIKKVQITPADIAEYLMPISAKQASEQRLLNLIQTLERRTQPEETKVDKEIAAIQEESKN